MRKAKEILFLLLRFLIVAYFISAIMLLLLALLLYKWDIPQTVISAGIVLTYVLSTFLTGFLAGKRMQHQKYLWGLCLGGLYFIILAILSVVIGGPQTKFLGNFATTMFICLGSGMLGGMLG